MKIFPAIDIKDGQCVRLFKGDFNKKTVYNTNPVAVAKELELLGAKYLHLVDLDGALGSFKNVDVVKEIIKQTNMFVELGGGIKNYDIARKWLNLGVNRIIIGSKALEDLNFVSTLIEEFGSDRIVVGIDAKDGYVSVNGWLDTSSTLALDFAAKLVTIGVRYVVYTDISKDGTLMGPNLQETKKIIDTTGLLVTVSGGISSLDDVIASEAIKAEAVIIGKAYYSGKIDLKSAIERIKE